LERLRQDKVSSIWGNSDAKEKEEGQESIRQKALIRMELQERDEFGERPEKARARWKQSLRLRAEAEEHRLFSSYNSELHLRHLAGRARRSRM